MELLERYEQCILSVFQEIMTVAMQEGILEALNKQKILCTHVFCKLVKLLKEGHLKTATELVHKYIKDPEVLYEKLF